MKTAVAALVLAPLLALPARAEAPPPPSPLPDEGFSLMEEGAKLLFRGLMTEMEPAISEMQRALDEIGPQLRQLAEMVGDFRNYDAPVRLPNGDILIRRKTPIPAEPLTPTPGPNGEIDL